MLSLFSFYTYSANQTHKDLRNPDPSNPERYFLHTVLGKNMMDVDDHCPIFHDRPTYKKASIAKFSIHKQISFSL